MKIAIKIPNNNDLVSVRKRFGMSQQQNMVTLAERGKRDFGTQPLLKLAALEINYVAPPEAAAAPAPPAIE